MNGELTSSREDQFPRIQRPGKSRANAIIDLFVFDNIVAFYNGQSLLIGESGYVVFGNDTLQLAPNIDSMTRIMYGYVVCFTRL